MTNRNGVQAGESPATTTYTSNGDLERDSLKTLLMGGVAAGAAGGLIVLLTERGEKKEDLPSRLEQARSAIEDATMRAMGDSKGSKKKAKKQGKKLGRKARKEQEQTQANIMNLLSAARDEIRGGVTDARKQAHDVSGIVDQARADASDMAKDARKRGEKLRKQAKKDAQKSKKEAGFLMNMLRNRASGLENMAESYVESKLLPRLKEFGEDASATLEEGRKDAREAADDARKRVEKDVMPRAREQAGTWRKSLEEDVLPEARERAQEFRKQAEGEWIPQARDAAEEFRKRAESDYLPQARDQVDQWRETVQEQADTASKAWEQGTEAAREQAHEAGESVKRGGRETRSLLIWLALAGTIIYKIFLNPDQQKKVRETGMQIFSEAKDMYGDMQGKA